MNNGVSYTSTKPLEEFEINKKNKPSDLISRQDAIDAIEKLISARYGWKMDARDEIQGLNAAYCAIIGLPSAQEATGYWIIFPPCFEEICMCSNCKTKFKEAYQHRDTCPSCGARMK